MPPDAPLLFWDFANVMSERGVSTAVGIPSDPTLVSGFVSQTGGGPAEVFGDGVGTVFLTRHLGTNDVFLWLTVTRPTFARALTLRHFHNHNPGFPTHPGYRVQLQLDAGDGYEKVGPPLELSGANYGGTDSFVIDRVLEPGSYKFRWHPQGLKDRARNTASEFFAFQNLVLHGHAHVGAAEPVPAPPATVSALPEPACQVPAAPASAPRASADPPGYVTVALAGVTVERLKVMESRFPGRCVRSGAEFDSGAVIGFKHRDALTPEQKAAIFGANKVGHLVVLLSAEEAAASGGA